MNMDTNKYKQIILIVLGIALVVGLGFLAVRSNNSIPKQENNLPNTTNTNTNTDNAAALLDDIDQFSQTITLNLNESISFSDGLTILLKKIDDSRCPEGVQCIWAGELSGTFALSGGKIVKAKEIHLGIMTNKSVVLDGYTFSIKDATKTSISISVANN
jgi:hypothetical protein